ncbi:MAG: helicase-related protein, partial [Promethearchaeia archaeon]
MCVLPGQLVGHGFRRLDGTTCLARRKYEIKMFNSKRGEQFVYLLSTRAGALGITLTGADTVIMYDSDWNPTWDKQAHDRVHRIGQDKEVTIYTLLCKDTVEQRIFQRAAQKLSLNELVLRDETDSKSERKEDVLSQSEVKKMLRCGVMKILESESTVMTE